MLEKAIDASPMCVGEPIDGCCSDAGEQILVNQTTDIEILHPGTAEVPSGFVVEKLGDAFFVEPGFNIRKCDGFSGLVFALFLQPRFVCQAIHLIQEVSGRDVKLFYLADFHEGTAEEDSIFVHYVGVREIGIAWKKTCDFFSVRKDSRFRNKAPVFGK